MTANGTSGRTDLGPRLDLRRKTQQRARRKRAIIIGGAGLGGALLVRPGHP